MQMASPPVPNKEVMVATRVTRARKVLYEQVAHSEGVRVSEWLRRLADRRVNEIAQRETAR
jgi:hypothetical protein